MKRKRKGQYGYIDYMKKYSAVRTLIWFLIAFAIFFGGIFYLYHPLCKKGTADSGAGNPVGGG